MKKGYFGEFGGCFVPELLMPPLQELEEAMRDIMPSPTFKEELDDLLRNFAGRETPLTYCPTLSKRLGFSLWLKREGSAAHRRAQGQQHARAGAARQAYGQNGAGRGNRRGPTWRGDSRCRRPSGA